MQSDNGVIQKVIIAAAIIVFIIFGFMVFVDKNNTRIMSQNTEYIGDATKQKSQILYHILNGAQENLNIRSSMYGQNLPQDTLDYEYFMKISQDTLFDHVEYVDKNGKNIITGDKDLKDVSDKEYFIKGMRGESGMVPMVGSGVYDENAIVFYTPFRVKGEIIGVLTGYYSEKQIEDLLHSTYFGEQADTFLCARDGSIISASTTEDIPENIIDYFREKSDVTPEELDSVKRALLKGDTYSLEYDNNLGSSSFYITDVDNTDFMIIQNFPSAVTQSMLKNAVSAGMELAVALVIALLVYVAAIVFFNYKLKKKLIKENKEMGYVIEGTTKLFDKFILVDLEEETYKYLTNTYLPSVEVPPEGKYEMFVNVFTSTFVYNDEKEKARVDLKAEKIRKDLGESVTNLYYEYYTERDKKQWESINIICLKREDGQAKQVLFAQQDITIAKNNELMKNIALKEAYKAAEAANEAKSDFLSHMSHDIRTPMNAIIGMTSIAAMHIDDTPRVMDCLNKITVSSKHLLGLINEVLDISKIESGKLVLSEEEFSLSETIDNLMTILHPQIQKKKQNFSVNINNIKHERVVGDSQRLSQVFVNIMSNAVKFTPDGGSISLLINEKPSKNTGSGYYEFIFTDSGIGMDSDFVATIFDPFSRATDSRVGKTEGTGLGMSIARNIVRMMNGDIQVKSTPGVGSVFTVSVYLQLCDDNNDKFDTITNLPVLVVDDEKDACESACEILNSIGMTSDWVTDGDSAVKKLVDARERGEDYAAVILDWKMPGKDGVQTASEIRDRIGKDIPIIILSAYNWSTIEEKARTVGVNYFISKPLFKSRLMYVMKNIAGKNDQIIDEQAISDKKYAGKRLLLVEDNDLNVEIAEEILRMVGFEVDTACDGVEAVKCVSDFPENYYDLILMDIQMPNMNGYEATAKIRAMDREDLKNIPIIAMSANTFTDDILEAKKSGMNAHIAKPIEISKMTDTIDACLGMGDN